MELISIRQAINLFSVSSPCTSTQWERLKGPTSWSPHWREEQIYDPWVACLNRAYSALQSTIAESSTTQTLCFILAPWDKREEDDRGGRQRGQNIIHSLQSYTGSQGPNGEQAKEQMTRLSNWTYSYYIQQQENYILNCLKKISGEILSKCMTSQSHLSPHFCESTSTHAAKFHFFAQAFRLEILLPAVSTFQQGDKTQSEAPQRPWQHSTPKTAGLGPAPFIRTLLSVVILPVTCLWTDHPSSLLQQTHSCNLNKLSTLTKNKKREINREKDRQKARNSKWETITEITHNAFKQSRYFLATGRVLSSSRLQVCVSVCVRRW